jgi:hypothetical protein
MELLQLVMMAMLTAIALLQIKSLASGVSMDKWLSEKKLYAISCIPGSSGSYTGNETGNDPNTGEDKSSSDNHNGSGCPHLLAGSLCKANETRRRSSRSSTN